jgi:hypothetical protein
VEAVEALGCQQGEVLVPEITVIVPWLVVDIAREEASNAAKGAGRLLDDRTHARQGGEGIERVGRPVSQFEDGVDHAASISHGEDGGRPAI